jgi:hypothetical protein
MFFCESEKHTWRNGAIRRVLIRRQPTEEVEKDKSPKNVARRSSSPVASRENVTW